MVSIVIPVYGAESLLSQLVRRIDHAMVSIGPYELILVCDASPDASWLRIKELAKENSKIKGVLLSRNFGQHYAITRGLQEVKGDWAVVMDCDLQDHPEEIPRLVQEMRKTQVEIVLARRAQRNDGIFKKFGSKAFYKVLNSLSGINIDPTVANFGLYSKKVVDAILSMGDSIRYFPAQVKWVGFSQTYLNVEHAKRPEGESSYNIRKLLKLAIDIILSYSDKPLRITIYLGLLMSMMSIMAALVYFIMALMGKFTVQGFPSIMISIWLLSGLMMSSFGIMGLYIGKIFQSVKGRPLVIDSEKTF